MKWPLPCHALDDERRGIHIGERKDTGQETGGGDPFPRDRGGEKLEKARARAQAHSQLGERMKFTTIAPFLLSDPAADATAASQPTNSEHPPNFTTPRFPHPNRPISLNDSASGSMRTSYSIYFSVVGAVMVLIHFASL